MSGIIQFVTTVIEGLKSVMGIIADGIEYLALFINAMPFIIVGPLFAGLAILVIYVILGRGS